MTVSAEIVRPETDRFAGTRSRFAKLGQDRDLVFATIMLGALIAFELFNFGTTEYALADLLGDLSLGAVAWATILALAFSAMDFAGIAWLFTPKKHVRIEVWYLIGAWLLAATMNAILTWWAVSLALLNHSALGNEVIARESLLAGAPVFVAVLVFLLRVLLIGTFTLSSRRQGLSGRRPGLSGRRRGLSEPTEARRSSSLSSTAQRPVSLVTREGRRNVNRRGKRTLVAQPISRR